MYAKLLKMSQLNWDNLQSELKGELYVDDLHRSIYATDASVYRMKPLGVFFPKDAEDISVFLKSLGGTSIGIIPRAAGTSLAGQCVGPGIVLDVSKNLNAIIDFDLKRKTVTVQPGVVRDELNAFLKPHGLFFGPNTSTANRCTIGGMVGNNSSGTTSIKYGVTRDKVRKIKALMYDGSEVVFETSPNPNDDLNSQGWSSKIYNGLHALLSPQEVKDKITAEFPNPSIHRRNTGYAIDELIGSDFLNQGNKPFDLTKLLCGSEGTLAISTEITISLDELPPEHSAMIVTHYKDLESCLSDVHPLMKADLFTCEMMDKVILDCTKNNREQLKNRFFVEGDPAALLMLELRANSVEELELQIKNLLKLIESSGLSYAHPILKAENISKALELRKAGLGLLGNIVGDKKAVACIEDTAVALPYLKDFILEFSALMKRYKQEAVYYAHAGAGELHLRPILNLKAKEDVVLFRKITTEVAELTKKYGGSFSGEHGDGIVRAEFIPMMIGKENYELIKKVKKLFDPVGRLNPGKITDSFKMDENLRYEVDRIEPEVSTFLDFSDSQGILRAVENCNGSGDCRKSEHAKGGMCPSYHATKNEKDTTRARANALREYLTNPPSQQSPFNREELKEVLDLCIGCKACSSECPSNVDMTTLKTEFLYQYQEANGYKLRDRLFAFSSQFNSSLKYASGLINRVYDSKVLAGLTKKIMGVAPERKLPHVHNYNFENYLNRKNIGAKINKDKKIVLFIDEFTRYMDVNLGKDAIDLLLGLGYETILYFGDSGRTFLSKGFLKQAKNCALQNVESCFDLLSDCDAIIGLEPSAILSFRDEYLRLLPKNEKVQKVANQSFLIEEFILNEYNEGLIHIANFTQEHAEVKIHAHCHQKSIANSKITFDLLSIPENYKATIIPSGCCGMAGSFGYEKEHYDISMKIGDLILFPAVRKASLQTIISANGTSCRHQIMDGTGREAVHPASILKEALKKETTSS